MTDLAWTLSTIIIRSFGLPVKRRGKMTWNQTLQGERGTLGRVDNSLEKTANPLKMGIALPDWTFLLRRLGFPDFVNFRGSSSGRNLGGVRIGLG